MTRLSLRTFVAAAGFAAAALFATSAGAWDMGSPRALIMEEPMIQSRLALGGPTRELPRTTRMVVEDPTGAPRGTVTVDTQGRALYLSLGDGTAMRYLIGVGRAGFEWKGTVKVGRKAEWPAWTPPEAMLKRRPDLPRHMEGGEGNPLGARAMYLYAGSRDSMFRIHGTNEADTIGQAVSSGCIRMLNDDVVDLYERVKVGTTVRVI